MALTLFSILKKKSRSLKETLSLVTFEASISHKLIMVLQLHPAIPPLSGHQATRAIPPDEYNIKFIEHLIP